MVRVTYNSIEIVQIAENDTSFTYTRDRVFIGEPEEAKTYLGSIGLDTAPIDEYIGGTYVPKEIHYVQL